MASSTGNISAFPFPVLVGYVITACKVQDLKLSPKSFFFRYPPISRYLLGLRKRWWNLDTLGNIKVHLVGGFNPSEKYSSKWIISPSRGENKKYLKTPPSVSFCWEMFVSFDEKFKVEQLPSMQKSMLRFHECQQCNNDNHRSYPPTNTWLEIHPCTLIDMQFLLMYKNTAPVDTYVL